jgi:hypothetical protein
MHCQPVPPFGKHILAAGVGAETPAGRADLGEEIGCARGFEGQAQLLAVGLATLGCDADNPIAQFAEPRRKPTVRAAAAPR